MDLPESLRSKLPRTALLIKEGLEEFSSVGGQILVSSKNLTVVDSAFGLASEGVLMTTETLMPWLSSGKPLTAVAMALLVDLGRCSFEDPVVHHIPEFYPHGKDAITIRHLLTHTSCLRAYDRLPDALEWNARIDTICAGKLDAQAIPGETAGYHIGSSWFILGEIVRRITGMEAGDYLRQALLLPLSMTDTWLSLTGDQFDLYGDRIGRMHLTSTGKPTPHPFFDSRESCAQPRPGGSVRGPVRQLARFYQAMLQRRDPSGDLLAIAPALSRETALNLTTRQRTGLMDLTFQFPMDWGLGFILNSNRHGAELVPYSFGRHASEDTFGHGGAQSSCAFADPQHDLVVAWVLNGMCGEKAHNRRSREINSAIYQDLGLA